MQVVILTLVETLTKWLSIFVSYEYEIWKQAIIQIGLLSRSIDTLLFVYDHVTVAETDVRW